MDKVLVDRELLERIDRCYMDGMSIYGECEEIRAILAQPAEAEGVDPVAWIMTERLERLSSGWSATVYSPAWAEHHLADVESVPLMTVAQHLAALSAVTAERDRLLEDAERYQWLKENVKHEFFGDQLVDLFTRSSQKIDRLVDAAMAAKEA